MKRDDIIEAISAHRAWSWTEAEKALTEYISKKVREAVLNQCDGTYEGSTPTLYEMSGPGLDEFIKELQKDITS